MRCYFTNEECDCDGDLETECPHDEMDHDDLESIDDGQTYSEQLAVESRMADMSERLDQCRASRR